MDIEKNLKLVQAGATRGFVTPKDSARALSELLRALCLEVGLLEEPVVPAIVESLVEEPEEPVEEPVEPAPLVKDVTPGSADDPESITLDSADFASPEID